VFFIAAAVYALGGILFCVLAKGTVQPWARDNTMMELEVVSTENTKASEANGYTSDGDVKRSPIYKPKAASNGELAAEPMLATKEV
jgi:hypothetical protein